MVTRRLQHLTARKRRSAPKKGREFEDQVASLYRLQGAEVIQNVEICNKKVDLLAVFTHPVKHRIIVECKNEEKTVAANQRVMQMHGLLRSARKTGEADSAEIVTKVRWGDIAQGYALREGIRLFTYTEKLSSLIDFTAYLKDLVSKFDKLDRSKNNEPALRSYYVELSASRYVHGNENIINDVDDYISEWVRSIQARHLAVFGEYGAGKSTLCQKIARDLSASFLRNPNSTRIPILLNLRDFVGKLDIEAYITSFLDRECGAQNPKIAIFRALNDSGILLLIFDGLDEMAVKVDRDTLESNLMEIEKLTSSPKAKVILTSRPEFFLNVLEQQEVISPASNALLTRAIKYAPIRILPWSDSQVEKFLQRRVPLVKKATQPWTFYRDQIRNIKSLSDLSHRPVLLEMIVKTLPALVASKKPINRPNLYYTYLTEEMRRQRVHKKRTLLISQQDRFLLLRQLAVALYQQSTAAINFSDVVDLIAQVISPPKQELEAHTRDFLTNSFLIRRDNEYYFSHKSIFEFLVAAHLAIEVRRKSPKLFGSTRLQPAIAEFLRDFQIDKQTLVRWVNQTKISRRSEFRFLGGNAATVLCLLSHYELSGKDLSRCDLTGADLRLANLDRTNLEKTILDDVLMTGTLFSENQLNKARVSDIRITYLVLETKLTSGEFEEKFVRLVHTQAEKIGRAHPVWVIEHIGTHSLASLQITCPTRQQIKLLLKVLSTHFDFAGLFSSQIEALIEKYPQYRGRLAQLGY